MSMSSVGRVQVSPSVGAAGVGVYVGVEVGVRAGVEVGGVEVDVGRRADVAVGDDTGVLLGVRVAVEVGEGKTGVDVAVSVGVATPTSVAATTGDAAAGSRTGRVPGSRRLRPKSTINIKMSPPPIHAAGCGHQALTRPSRPTAGRARGAGSCTVGSVAAGRPSFGSVAGGKSNLGAVVSSACTVRTASSRAMTISPTVW
jgi:hypothetical protein